MVSEVLRTRPCRSRPVRWCVEWHTEQAYTATAMHMSLRMHTTGGWRTDPLLLRPRGPRLLGVEPQRFANLWRVVRATWWYATRLACCTGGAMGNTCTVTWAEWCSDAIRATRAIGAPLSLAPLSLSVCNDALGTCTCAGSALNKGRSDDLLCPEAFHLE